VRQPATPRRRTVARPRGGIEIEIDGVVVRVGKVVILADASSNADYASQERALLDSADGLRNPI
jgi:hypothetical protein